MLRKKEPEFFKILEVLKVFFIPLKSRNIHVSRYACGRISNEEVLSNIGMTYLVF